MFAYGGIGEVVNTPDCGSGMRGFDSHISPHVNTNYDSVSYRNFFIKYDNIC